MAYLAVQDVDVTANKIPRINISFIDKDGTKVDLQVAEGDNLLDIAQANDLEMEGMSSAPLSE